MKVWLLPAFLALFILPCVALADAPQDQDAFSPHQGATTLIVRTIGEAKKSVCVAAYSFTSHPIAAALITAHNNGIDVRVIMDKSQRRGRSLGGFLQRNHIPVRINRHYAIMHNKFMVIDDQVLELGSFNYTKAAEEKNAENVLVIHDDPHIVKDYAAQWQKLWGEGEDIVLIADDKGWGSK